MQDIPGPDQITVADVCELYKAMGMRELAETTKPNVFLSLRDFAEEFGHKKVVDCKPVELIAYMQSNEPRWKSAHTRAWRLAAIKRAFNWALDLQLVAANPFARVRVHGAKARRKPMSDDVYQALLRNSPAIWRRLLVFLRFTGSRTCEASALCWKHIDLANGVAILPEHKTANRTGKPRIIPLSPVAVKLLVWMKTHRQASVVGLLEKLLSTGPKHASQVWRFARQWGVSNRAMFKARKRLGVERYRVGGDGPGGWDEYRLPPGHVVPPDPIASDRVFLSTIGLPQNKNCMSQYVRRLAAQGIVPKGTSLYQLRHAYGTRGIRNNVSIKLVSLAMGHTRVATTEIYVDNEAVSEQVLEAVTQINHGKAATLKLGKIQEPREIVMPTYGQTIEEMSTKAIVLPNANGVKPHSPVPITPTISIPSGVDPAGVLMQKLLAKLGELEANKPPPRARKPKVTIARTVKPCEQAAYDAYCWALAQSPELAKANDPEVYAWLIKREDCPHKVPRLQETFRRYLGAARLLFDCRKRPMTTRIDPPTPTKEAQP